MVGVHSAKIVPVAVAEILECRTGSKLRDDAHPPVVLCLRRLVTHLSQLGGRGDVGARRQNFCSTVLLLVLQPVGLVHGRIAVLSHLLLIRAQPRRFSRIQRNRGEIVRYLKVFGHKFMDGLRQAKTLVLFHQKALVHLKPCLRLLFLS